MKPQIFILYSEFHVDFDGMNVITMLSKCCVFSFQEEMFTELEEAIAEEKRIAEENRKLEW